MVEIINHYFLYDNKVGYQVKTHIKVDTNRGLSLKSPPAPPIKSTISEGREASAPPKIFRITFWFYKPLAHFV